MAWRAGKREEILWERFSGLPEGSSIPGGVLTRTDFCGFVTPILLLTLDRPVISGTLTLVFGNDALSLLMSGSRQPSDIPRHEPRPRFLSRHRCSGFLYP